MRVWKNEVYFNETRISSAADANIKIRLCLRNVWDGFRQEPTQHGHTLFWTSLGGVWLMLRIAGGVGVSGFGGGRYDAKEREDAFSVYCVYSGQFFSFRPPPLVN